jgi:hypothetical protein
LIKSAPHLDRKVFIKGLRHALRRFADFKPPGRRRAAFWRRQSSAKELKLAPQSKERMQDMGDTCWLFALEIYRGAASLPAVLDLLMRRWRFPERYDSLLLGASGNDNLLVVQRFTVSIPEPVYLADVLETMERFLTS